MSPHENEPMGGEPDAAIAIVKADSPDAATFGAILRAKNASSRGKKVADLVMGSIRGGEAAKRLIATIRAGHNMPGTLHQSLLEVISTQDPGQLDGWARQIEKTLERAIF